jgi:oxygen-independent coproporphyrinogen III oxidase
MPPAPPRAAYIHVPFCRHRCGYCNFTLVAGRDDLIASYLEALELELQLLQSPREVDTLFFGGGTPSHLPPTELARLIELVRKWHPLNEGYEFSIEANPIDLTPERMKVLVAGGVNRISLGVQSFDDAKLQMLERDHRADEIRRAFDLCRENVRSVSLDLIFGSPGETREVWSRDLEFAQKLLPDHLSTYGLTFERGSAFYGRRERGEIVAQSEADEAGMYEEAIDTLTTGGFVHYEVSNFAKPGHNCRHNEVYWTGQQYFAAGPGAARYVDGRREVNHRSPTTWLRRLMTGESPVGEGETLSPEDIAREAFVFGLRRLEGIRRSTFEAATGISLDAMFGIPLRRQVELELLLDDGENIRLSRRGLLVSDAIWPEFLG